MLAVHTIPAAFTRAECARLTALAAAAPADDARLARAGRDHNLRRARIVWLDDLPGAGWAMQRIVELVAEANRAAFRFDLADFSESAQIAAYDAAVEGHFTWHADIGDGALAARRKLTMVVQLSDRAGYGGGRLELMPSAQVVLADDAQGVATVFPSYMLHRVTPVTAGTRRSLTIWAHGPAFR